MDNQFVDAVIRWVEQHTKQFESKESMKEYLNELIEQAFETVEGN